MTSLAKRIDYYAFKCKIIYFKETELNFKEI